MYRPEHILFFVIGVEALLDITIYLTLVDIGENGYRRILSSYATYRATLLYVLGGAVWGIISLGSVRAVTAIGAAFALAARIYAAYWLRKQLMEEHGGQKNNTDSDVGAIPH